MFFVKLITAVLTISMTLYFLYDTFIHADRDDKTLQLCVYIIFISILIVVESKMWLYCRYNIPCVNLEAKCSDDDTYTIYLDGRRHRYSGQEMRDTFFCKPGEHELMIEYKGQKVETKVEVTEMLLLNLHLYGAISFDCESVRFPADPKENRRVQNKLGLIYLIVCSIMMFTIILFAIIQEQRYDILFN